MWVTGEYYDSLRDVETAARGRLGESQAEPFDRLDWFKRSWSCEPLGHRPLIVRTRVTGAEAWLFFVRQRPNLLAPLAGPHTSRVSAVFAGEPEAEVRHTLVRAAAKRLRVFGATRIEFGPLLPDDAAALRQSFVRAGWVAAQRSCGANYTLDATGQSFDDYWDRRPGELHEQIEIGSRSLNVEIADLLSPRLWDELKLLAGDDHFLRELAQDATLDRTLRLAVARVGDAPVAAQLWTVEGDRGWCHWRGADRDARHLFPAAQLNAAMLRYLMNVDHVRLIDLGNADGADLEGWADSRRRLSRLTLLNPSAPSTWASAMAAKAAALVRRAPLD